MTTRNDNPNIITHITNLKANLPQSLRLYVTSCLCNSLCASWPSPGPGFGSSSGHP